MPAKTSNVQSTQSGDCPPIRTLGTWSGISDNTVAVGASVKVILTAKDSQKAPVQLRADATVTYTIDNSKIATVSADGTVTFVKKGETELIVTVTQDGFSARARVPVITE